VKIPVQAAFTRSSFRARSYKNWTQNSFYSCGFAQSERQFCEFIFERALRNENKVEGNIEGTEAEGNKKIRCFARISFFKGLGTLVSCKLPGGITNFLA